jgi:hypothetical protein
MSFQIYNKALPEYKKYFHHKTADAVVGDIKREKNSREILGNLAGRIISNNYNTKDHPRLQQLVQIIQAELAKPIEVKKVIKKVTVQKPNKVTVQKPSAHPVQQKPSAQPVPVKPNIQIFPSRQTNAGKAKQRDFESLILQLVTEDPLTVVQRRKRAADVKIPPATKLARQAAEDSYILPMTELDMLKKHASTILQPAKYAEFEKNLKIACKEALRLRKLKKDQNPLHPEPQTMPAAPKRTALEARVNNMRNLAHMLQPQAASNPMPQPQAVPNPSHLPVNGPHAPIPHMPNIFPHTNGNKPLNPESLVGLPLEDQFKAMAANNPNMAFLFNNK